ncbi:Ig-like domain-containing protein, partial [Acinetobacter baumannii]|nr:Ig-like domain-containing protein [Acinetobacter baumannii]
GDYSATATDVNGNTGPSTMVTLDDNVGPNAPSFTVTSNADGTATISGTAEPGSTVVIKDPNGKDVPVTVNPDGSFTATVESPAAEGEYKAIATDMAGNEGSESRASLDDNTAPTAPVVTDTVENEDGSTTVTGTA